MEPKLWEDGWVIMADRSWKELWPPNQNPSEGIGENHLLKPWPLCPTTKCITIKLSCWQAPHPEWHNPSPATMWRGTDLPFRIFFILKGIVGKKMGRVQFERGEEITKEGGSQLRCFMQSWDREDARMPQGTSSFTTRLFQRVNSDLFKRNGS